MNEKYEEVFKNNMNSSNNELDSEKKEQIERGKRIKAIRENELQMNKTQLAKKIGVSGQFLGLVEDGKGNLVYKSIKKLKDLSGHSADYILYGLDDSMISQTKQCLEKYSENQIINTIEFIKQISIFIKNIK